ncbi:MAG: hypothetical protein WD179_08035 [Actinomycetota bacterium]
MNKLLKILLVAVLALGGLSVGAVAQAQNDAEDDISSSTEQSGSSGSGDAVAGQVVGVVSAGDTSVDATNHSEDVDIETGAANGFNGQGSFTGQFNEDGDENELEDGEISSETVQASESNTGDGVGGQVIGVVTSAGGSADVVAANTSEDVDIETGDSFSDNFADFGTGQATFDGGGENDAEDDISSEVNQTASASSGDGVGGQVLGIVSAGDASVDATNESTDVDIETGLASADNFAGFNVAQESDGGGDNFSDGDISGEIAQDASATSGDAVAGQVAGVVTSAGGSADLVLANTSEDVDAESGDSFHFNEVDEFVGQQTEGGIAAG